MGYKVGGVREKRGKNGLEDKKSYGDRDWQIWGIPIYGRGVNGVLRMVGKRLRQEGGRAEPLWIATVNPEFIIAAEKDKRFKEVLQEKTVNVPDGIGLVWARKVTQMSKLKDQNQNPKCKSVRRWLVGLRVGAEILMGKHREELVTGADLMTVMCGLSKKLKVFFLGGWGDRAERTAAYFRKKTGVETAWSPGEPEVKNEEVIDKINNFGPDILLVAYGMKRQEEWIDKHFDKLNTKVVMGVGRSFDYYSGELKRAPEWVRKMGLEWLYSLYREPKRWKRQLELPRFIGKVIWGS